MTTRKKPLRSAYDRLRGPTISALATTPAWWLLPTLSMLAFNAEKVEKVREPAALPATAWAQRERHAMMVRSEERLRTIETKGPGLSAVTAVIGAAVLLAIGSGWQDSCLPAQLALGLAAFYSLLSLGLPLYLVGPQPRHTIHERELLAASASDDPEEELAKEAARAAAANDRRNLLLNNLQAAARREALYAVGLLLVWAVAVPVTGLLKV